MDLNNYSKNTVILTSDRLILNSKDDSVFITSKKTIGMSATDQLHINVGPLGKTDPSKHFIIVNTPYMQIGMSGGPSPLEPVAKADSTIAFITKLLDNLNAFAKSLSTATAVGVGISKLPEIAIASELLVNQLRMMKDTYTSTTSPIKSTITKTA